MEKVCAKALKKWGLKAQETILTEEIGELLQAVSKYRRSNGAELSRENLAEEIADVRIMLTQMEIGHNIEKSVEDWIKYKIKILEKRMED